MLMCIPQNRIDLVLEVLDISEDILGKLMEAAPECTSEEYVTITNNVPGYAMMLVDFFEHEFCNLSCIIICPTGNQMYHRGK